MKISSFTFCESRHVALDLRRIVGNALVGYIKKLVLMMKNVNARPRHCWMALSMAFLLAYSPMESFGSPVDYDDFSANEVHTAHERSGVVEVPELVEVSQLVERRFFGLKISDRDSTQAEATAATSEDTLEELFWSRRTDQKMSFDAADVTFMTMMIPHHAQALVMSEMAERNEAGPAVRTLASRIMNAQGDEIATMQRWLEVRKQPVPRIRVEGLVMTIETEMPEKEDAMDHRGMTHSGMDHGEMDNDTMEHSGMDHSEMDHSEMHHPDGKEDRSEMIHGSDHGEMDHDEMDHSKMDHSSGTHSHHDMPGMLSQEQLEHLASLRGAEFDRWYLTYMIGHHEGAIIMVDELFASEKGGRDEESFRLASDIYTEQTTEIDRMKFMLRQMD